MKWLLGLCIFLTGLSAESANITAASCGFEDVSNAVASASNGDRVIIPSGNCVWSNNLDVSKAITITGAGTSLTQIWRTNSHPIITISTNAILTALTLRPLHDAWGIRISGGHGWRIHHMRIEAATTWTDAFLAESTIDGDHVSGLVDNCDLVNARINVAGWDGLLANKLWNQPNDFGTTNAVYVESCNVILTGGANLADINYGGKLVIRYCTLVDGPVENHSNQGGGRGTKFWEYYMNTIMQSNRALNYPMQLRGGTGVIWSNTVIGSWTHPDHINMDNVRSSEQRLPPGFADGHSQWDGNRAATNGTGTHSGANNALILNDPTKSWITSQFTKPGAPTNNWIYNLTDGSLGQITTNTATTVTVAVLTNGANNVFSNGDSYLITYGYPARDQIGRGYEATLNTNTLNTLGAWPTQLDEPVYIWTNNFGTTNLNVNLVNGANNPYHIVSNRDWIVGMKPGYTPLTFPHPLNNDSAGSAIITAVPSSLNFGTIVTNSSTSLTFYVTNSGTATLTSGSASTSAPFSISGNADYSGLVPNAYQVITVTYSPTTAGTDSGTVTCTGGGGATVSLSGSATNAPFFGVMTKISGNVTISGATVIK